MKFKKIKLIIIIVVLFISMSFSGALKISKVNAAQIINLARTEGVVATSDCFDGNLTADKAIDGDTVERTSRWSSKNIWDTDDPHENNHDTCHGHWLQIAFPNEVKIHSVKIYWELLNAEIYSIESSMDGINWSPIKQFNHTPDSAVQIIEFDQIVTLSYLRLRTEKMDTTDTVNPIHPYYQNVSLYEIEVYGEAPASQVTNLSLSNGVIATSDCHTGTYAPDLAIDGDESFKSKWSSENIWDTDDPDEFNHESSHKHWLQLEFPEEVTAYSAVIKWEKPNAEIYELEYSNDGTNWKTIQKFTEIPGPLPEGIDILNATEIPVKQEIIFENELTFKFIRVRTEKISKDGNINIYFPYHQNIVISEFEVYGNDPDYEINSIAAQIEAPVVIINSDGTRRLSNPKVPEGYQIEFIGADYEQIIGDDGIVYPTIEDKIVNVGYKVIKGKRSVESPSLEVIVPSAVNVFTENPNLKPLVIPELAEWRGGEGNFVINNDSKIILGNEDLMEVAYEFSHDYEDLTGRRMEIISGKYSDVKNGDFYLDISNSDRGLGDEGYLCQITDSIKLTGQDPIGIYWGTRSILQIIKQTGTEIAKGEIRDYPKYKVRGFGIDVGRQTVSLDMLKEYAKTMSWYKMNDLHIHLNDNEILGYSGKIDSVENALTAYSGFRLESSITNENGLPLTNEDMYYTKDDFRDFIKNSRKIGVNIVPEIDSPAHSLAFTKLFPEYAFTTDPSHVDQIDLSIPGAVDLMKQVYNEYITGDNPVFDNNTTVHIGMDEYFGNGDIYRQYGNTLIDLLGSRKVRMWGSLSNIKGATKVKSENVEMNIWHTMWANPKEMYDLGYGLINSQNGSLYIIPGGGWDYLDTEKIYNEWVPNIFVDSQNDNKKYDIPAYSKQMLGGSYTMWHDLTGNIDYGLTEYDDFVRFLEPLSVISEKLWAEGNDKSFNELTELTNIINLSPNSNPYNKIKSNTSTILHYDFEEADCIDTSGNQYNAISNSANIVDGKRGKAFDLSNNKTIIMPLNKIGPDYTISFWIKRNENSNVNEQILFETSIPFDQENSKEKFHTYQFKAVQNKTGKVGISREYFDYSFDYSLPKGEWVYLTVEGKLNVTNLYVNGKLTSSLGSSETWSPYATTPFPLGQIGSKEKGFEGMIDKLTVTDGTSPFALDKTELNQKILEAKNIQFNIYTKDSCKKVQDAIKIAEKLLNSSEVDILINDVNIQINNLTKAIELLEENAEELENYRNNIVLENPDLYTTKSYNYYLEAYNNLMELEFGNTSKKVFNQCKELFESAEKNLIKKTYKTALSIALDMAKSVTQEQLDKVVPVVANEFKAALQNAQNVFDNVKATQEEVNNAFDRLSKVMQMLEFYKGDKIALQKMMDQIASLSASDYTDSTWKALQAVLPNVNEVLENANAMQEEVDEVYTELVKAFVNLRLKPNKDLLNDLINQANGLNRANYTVASLKIVDEEVAKANKVLNDPEATVEEVTNAVNGLTKAMAGLVANPGNPAVENTTNNPGNTVKPGDTTVNAIKTGDEILVIIPINFMVLSISIYFILRKRKYLN
ncbi:family 20 glycosylhydrolase [Thomasclavelia sp.]